MVWISDCGFVRASRNRPQPGSVVETRMQTLRDVLYSLSAVNFVDIAIMACLVYFFTAWLKGTRAFQILATMFGIGLFYLAASSLGLILTSVLFQYLWAAIIIVLVIVFQP